MDITKRPKNAIKVKQVTAFFSFLSSGFPAAANVRHFCFLVFTAPLGRLVLWGMGKKPRGAMHFVERGAAEKKPDGPPRTFAKTQTYLPTCRHLF
jgi:hypothetical protein